MGKAVATGIVALKVAAHLKSRNLGLRLPDPLYSPSQSSMLPILMPVTMQSSLEK
jgi:hypothetical protein